MSSTCLETGVFGHCLTRFTKNQAVALSIDAEAGLISSLAIITFLLLVFRNVIKVSKHPPPGGWSLLRTHVDVYFADEGLKLGLLLFELLHGVAASMSARWIIEGEIYCSNYCTIQGAIRNAGSTAVALTTQVIGIHTFAVIFFKWVPPRSLLIPFSVLLGICTFLIVYLSYQVSIPRPAEQAYFSPTPYWCWIGPNHTGARIWGQYVWIWLTAFLSILLYVPLYFCVKGNISYRPSSRWKIHICRSPKLMEDSEISQTLAAKVATTDAMCMLYYPAAYVLLCLPLSIVRFTSEAWQEEGREFPFAPTVTGSAIFELSGLVNVILFMSTRPNLLLFRSHYPPPPPLRYKLHGPRFQSEGPGYPTSPPSTGHSIDPLVTGSRVAHTQWRDFEMT